MWHCVFDQKKSSTSFIVNFNTIIMMADSEPQTTARCKRSVYSLWCKLFILTGWMFEYLVNYCWVDNSDPKLVNLLSSGDKILSWVYIKNYRAAFHDSIYSHISPLAIDVHLPWLFYPKTTSNGPQRFVKSQKRPQTLTRTSLKHQWADFHDSKSSWKPLIIIDMH